MHDHYSKVNNCSTIPCKKLPLKQSPTLQVEYMGRVRTTTTVTMNSLLMRERFEVVLLNGVCTIE